MAAGAGLALVLLVLPCLPFYCCAGARAPALSLTFGYTLIPYWYTVKPLVYIKPKR